MKTMCPYCHPKRYRLDLMCVNSVEVIDFNLILLFMLLCYDHKFNFSFIRFFDLYPTSGTFKPLSHSCLHLRSVWTLGSEKE